MTHPAWTCLRCGGKLDNGPYDHVLCKACFAERIQPEFDKLDAPGPMPELNPS